MTMRLEVALYHHLNHNLYPPMGGMYCAALDAIRGNTDEQGRVSAPALGESAWVPAEQVIENLRLHEFLEDNA